MPVADADQFRQHRLVDVLESAVAFSAVAAAGDNLQP
jgi:hypothetical protein